ncbi:hypothetical protein [Sulfitobacter sp. SK012]|uniref:hypothetical protein n=1 Tax=Sulfitobacter sp. SK012 TaxID=1389005 RepID=UPI0013B44DA4|nr:hypothetical protein [Sulfitobacter sp. SK012]
MAVRNWDRRLQAAVLRSSLWVLLCDAIMPILDLVLIVERRIWISSSNLSKIGMYRSPSGRFWIAWAK